MGGVIFWAFAVGPLKTLLPQSSQKTLSLFIPDYFAGNRGGLTQSPGGGLPTSKPSDKPAEIMWSVPSSDGTAIDVSPFMPASTTTSTSTTSGTQTGGTQSDGNVSKTPPKQNVDIVGTEQPLSPYIITYVASDQSFNIGLFKEPLGDVRKQAEQDFLTKLGVTQAEACRLKHVVQTPFWVSSFYGGKNLGFSFCPGATQL